MSETWDDTAPAPASVGEIELVIKWPDNDPANVVLFANCELLDAGGNSIGRKYVRATVSHHPPPSLMKMTSFASRRPQRTANAHRLNPNRSTSSRPDTTRFCHCPSGVCQKTHPTFISW